LSKDLYDVESALIARMLLEPDENYKTAGLAGSDFQYPNLGKMFDAIIRRINEGKSYDSVTIQEDTDIKFDIMELSPGAFGPVEEYIDAIKKAAVRREYVRSLNEAIGKITDGEDDPAAIIAATLGDISVGRSADGLRGADEVIRSYSDEFRRRGTVEGGGGLTYGIPALDSSLLPMRSGRLVVFASRPGIGKTALAESVSDHAAHFAPVLFVSLEMGAEELTDRAMARASGIKAGAIMRGEIGIEKLDEHLKARSDLPITYLDEGMTTTADILAAANKVKMQNEGRLGLIIVDYLQLVADRGENEVYRVGHISHALKRMALKLKCPVLALVQLNRSIEYTPRAPKLSDMRDSGIIEADADVVVIITGDIMEPGRDLFILKQRAGHVGRVSLDFDGDTQRWSAKEW